MDVLIELLFWIVLMCAVLVVGCLMTDPLYYVALSLTYVSRAFLALSRWLFRNLSEHAGALAEDIGFWIGDRVMRSHRLCRELGLVCQRCTDNLPGWWDYSTDCHGHRCRRCTVCLAKLSAGDFENA